MAADLVYFLSVRDVTLEMDGVRRVIRSVEGLPIEGRDLDLCGIEVVD